jgi:hypothetical protein
MQGQVVRAVGENPPGRHESLSAAANRHAGRVDRKMCSVKIVFLSICVEHLEFPFFFNTFFLWNNEAVVHLCDL